MTASEKEFVDYWKVARQKWSWGKTLKRGILYIAWPAILMIDLINFFIIGDIKYAFISFPHLINLIQNLLIGGIIIGFCYGFYNWTSNEQRYLRILKDNHNES